MQEATESKQEEQFYSQGNIHAKTDQKRQRRSLHIKRITKEVE